MEHDGTPSSRDKEGARGVEDRYFDYCSADPDFYDIRPDLPAFAIASRPLPDGWRARTADGWCQYEPAGVALPPQGWKIHASAGPHNAAEVLGVVWDYCVAHGVAFKHLASPLLLVANNAKHASRGSSAKLAAIYPLDDQHFGRILDELAPLLDGQPGAYILSDLRWGKGPLYVRYGGFANRYEVFDRGEPEPAIEDPAGRVVPDRREPVFRVPPWVTVPECLAPHLAARNAVTVADLPYRVERALHFSNGGGVYAGVHRDSGERVVLKEARPHAGLDSTHADAVSRLERERMILEHLAGVEFVPAVRGHFTAGEHHFLALEFIDGTPLNEELGRRFPLSGRPDETALRGHVDWAVAVIDDVERNVEILRQRGVVFGDLHPLNIMLRPDGRTALIDFETASLIGEGRRPALGHPGFTAPPDRTGFDADRYALACLRLTMFLPVTTLLGLDRAKAAQLASEIYEIFPLPAGYLDDAVRTIMGDRPVRALPPIAKPSMADAILASATPERDDRLFPGDIAQFSTGGLNLAYGAAGVLFALDAAGAGRYPAHERWLIDRAGRGQGRLGFYDGLHGVAYALDRLGHRDEAMSLLRAAQRGAWRRLGPDLASGLAGIGLNLLHFGDLDAAGEVAALVAARLDTVPRAGLMHGCAGPALLFIRLFESSGDKDHLDLAANALDHDLRKCVPQTDGSLQVDDGWRTLPYLATGSIGIGLVLREFLRHRPDERYTEALARISLAAQSDFYAQPGLFNGRAGALLFHRDSPANAARQVSRLAWHAMNYRGHLAFPGEQLYRLSMDLATGTAGVLLALAAADGKPDAALPFIPSAARGGDVDGAARPSRAGSADP
jgi:serine/threonine protein kinase